MLHLQNRLLHVHHYWGILIEAPVFPINKSALLFMSLLKLHPVRIGNMVRWKDMYISLPSG